MPRHLRRWSVVGVALGLVLGVALTFMGPTWASRNSGGTYTLPSGTTVTSGTTITSTWANTLTADLQTEVTSSLDRSGRGAMLAPLKLSSGSDAAPSLTFGADTDLGLYRAGANNIAMVCGSSSVCQEWSSTTTTFPLGIVATQSATNGDAIFGTGNGTGSGVVGYSGSTAGATTSGVYGKTTAAGGAAGVAGESTSSASMGVFGTSAGGTGVYGESTASNGSGVSGLGYGTGTGVVGVGGSATTGGAGGSFTAHGTASPGLDSRGSGTGAGGTFTGGATGAGIIAVSGAATKASIEIGGTNPASTTGFTNALTTTSIVKAWGLLTGTSGTWVVTSGFNVANPACSSSTVTLDIADDMANTSFVVIANGTISGFDGSWYKGAPNVTGGSAKFLGYVFSGANVVQSDLCGATGTIQFLVLGAQ